MADISHEDIEVLTPLLLPNNSNGSTSADQCAEKSLQQIIEDNSDSFDAAIVQVKRKNPFWNEAEKNVLVEEVQRRIELLFGKFKGAKRSKEEKENSWKDVCIAVNSVGLHKRSVEEIKKQYSSIRQRAKEKFSEIRRPKTGGGPQPPAPTDAEQVVLDGLEGRPSLQGLEKGYDTIEEPMEKCDVLEEKEQASTSKKSTAKKRTSSIYEKEKVLIEKEILVADRKQRKLDLQIEVLSLQKTKLQLEIKTLMNNEI